MQTDIAIVVVAYNRPHSLRRLLYSLERAEYGGYDDVKLIISIDKSDNEACKIIADDFKWSFGEKKILIQKENLGLKKHIIKCGDLSNSYDAVIILEDDLYVSSVFYDYAHQAYSFYKEEGNVAGISLYHNTFNETALCPFEAVHDGFDNYFMQVPSSWGQLWSRKQWQNFKIYIDQPVSYTGSDFLPDNVQAWPDSSSWKKMFYKYLIESNRYIVYPRIGLTTNFGDTGTHLNESISAFQSPLLLAKRKFIFSAYQHSCSMYDSFYELAETAYGRIIKNENSVSFDLNGTKPVSTIKSTYLFSIKKCSKPIKKYSFSMYPYENNILLNQEISGADEKCFISFGETSSFTDINNFEKTAIDFKRVFLHENTIINATRKEVQRSKPYRLGLFLLRPYYFFKNRIRLLRK